MAVSRRFIKGWGGAMTMENNGISNRSICRAKIKAKKSAANAALVFREAGAVQSHPDEDHKPEIFSSN
jgi:hypothetical protein